jgi:hypothetical protein
MKLRKCSSQEHEEHYLLNSTTARKINLSTIKPPQLILFLPLKHVFFILTSHTTITKYV